MGCAVGGVKVSDFEVKKVEILTSLGKKRAYLTP
jgi:hypothetical protein